MKTALFNCHSLFTKLLKWYKKVFLDIKLVGKQQKLHARYQTMEKNGSVRCYWLGNLSARANKSDIFFYPSPDTVTEVGNSLLIIFLNYFGPFHLPLLIRETRICGLVTFLVLSVIDNVDRIKMLFRKGGSVCGTQVITWWKKNSRSVVTRKSGFQRFQRFFGLLTGCIIFHIISLASPIQICLQINSEWTAYASQGIFKGLHSCNLNIPMCQYCITQNTFCHTTDLPISNFNYEFSRTTFFCKPFMPHLNGCELSILLLYKEYTTFLFHMQHEFLLLSVPIWFNGN